MLLLKQLLWKMSAKLGAMMQRNPYSRSDQGACSREEPQPKFSPAIRMPAVLVTGLVEDELRVGRAAVLEVTPVREQVVGEAGTTDRLQEAGGDDVVRVDVGPHERHRGALIRDEFLHGDPFSACLSSAATGKGH